MGDESVIDNVMLFIVDASDNREEEEHIEDEMDEVDYYMEHRQQFYD